MYRLIIAEKPSVARDIAKAIGVTQKDQGFIGGDGIRVTWAIGHLVSLAEPDEIDPRYRKWRAEDLPILPEGIPLKVLPKTKAQFALVKKLMNAKECESIVCATDAGREGELIFRYLYQMAGCKKPFDRLWISSMTDAAIREGFNGIKPGSAYDALYESARCRSEADWLVGMNASRAFTIRYGVLLSVGRVQTPTLSLLVKRHHEIAAFVPKAYWTIEADFGDYKGLWKDEQTNEKRVYDEKRAEEIASRVKEADALIESVTREGKTEWPPYLYDLTSLQRDANRLLGFTAKKTLSVAQKLYEEDKLLTYPRTDSRHLPNDMEERTRKAITLFPAPYAALAEPILKLGKLPMHRRVFDDAKVTDHHAIIPTDRTADLSKLSRDAAALYDLVARRLLASFYDAHLYDAIRVHTRASGELFESLGRQVKKIGWKAVYANQKQKDNVEEQNLPPGLAEGQSRTLKAVRVKADKTKPPAKYSDASLLAAMENAGRDLQDEELRESMKSHGLGTPATRAAMIERLIEVGYAKRNGRQIEATEKGIQLIAVVPPEIASPETTGRWEKGLSDIASGGLAPDRFLSGIRKLSATLCERAKSAPSSIQFEQETRRKPKGARGGNKNPAQIGVKCPLCKQGDVLENSKAFYCSRYREGCGLTIWKDALVRQGGPILTEALVKRALTDGRVRGSTGVLAHEHGKVWFEPK